MQSHVLVYLALALILAAFGPILPPAARPALAQELLPAPQLTSPSIADATPGPSPSHLPTATTHPVTSPTAALVSVEGLKPANLT
jgi:hypothetical protein